MYGRMYTASVGTVVVSAIQDLIEINAASDSVVIVHAIYLGQTSDVGDAAEEILQVQISRTTGSAGSGGSTATARPMQVGDAAYGGGAIQFNNTTQAGSTTVLHEDAFNIRVGWQYLPPPEQRIIISPSGVLVIELPVQPSDEITMDISVVLEEIGG